MTPPLRGLCLPHPPRPFRDPRVPSRDPVVGDCHDAVTAARRCRHGLSTRRPLARCCPSIGPREPPSRDSSCPLSRDVGVRPSLSHRVPVSLSRARTGPSRSPAPPPPPGLGARPVTDQSRPGWSSCHRAPKSPNRSRCCVTGCLQSAPRPPAPSSPPGLEHPHVSLRALPGGLDIATALHQAWLSEPGPWCCLRYVAGPPSLSPFLAFLPAAFCFLPGPISFLYLRPVSFLYPISGILLLVYSTTAFSLTDLE